MKQICPLSGIVWEAEGFSTGHRRLELPHPVFSLPLKYLVTKEIDWSAGRLSPIEKKLLFLAVLKQSELVKWFHPANPSEAIVENHFLSVLRLTVWKDGIVNPNLDLPMYSINKNTCNMENIQFWIAAWNRAKQEFEAGIIRRKRLEIKLKLEEYLEARIRTVELGFKIETGKYLKMLAAWASITADFPEFIISHPFFVDENHKPIQLTLSEYWKEIIAAPMSSVLSYPARDIKELEDHLIENIDDYSTVYYGALIRKVRAILRRNTCDIGVELVELPEDEMFPGQKRYEERMVESEGTTNAINTLIAEGQQYSQEPQEKEFPNRASYFKALIRWKMAQKSKSGDSK